MPRHDFRCPDCKQVAEVTLKITERAMEANVWCVCCPTYGVLAVNVKMEWIPKVGRMDAGNGSSFTAFAFQQRQPDGSFKEVQVSSLRQLRKIEHESEQRARDGEGEATRFRMWSHNDSNGDVNSFGPDPSVQAQAELAKLRQQAIAAGARDRETRLEKIVGEDARKNAEQLGPGVTGASTGAFMEEISLG